MSEQTTPVESTEGASGVPAPPPPPPDDENPALIFAKKTFAYTTIGAILFVGAVVIFIL